MRPSPSVTSETTIDRDPDSFRAIQSLPPAGPQDSFSALVGIGQTPTSGVPGVMAAIATIKKLSPQSQRPTDRSA